MMMTIMMIKAVTIKQSAHRQ